MAAFNLKVVTPVSFSPLITAQLIGAAPLYEGSNEPCTLMVPMGGMSQTTSGSILKATTTNKLAFKTSSALINAGSFNLIGCRTGKLFSTAYFFTALCCNCKPRPAGLSGAVTTDTMLKPAFTNASNEATAKGGVPIKTIRVSFAFIAVILIQNLCRVNIFF